MRYRLLQCTLLHITDEQYLTSDISNCSQYDIPPVTSYSSGTFRWIRKSFLILFERQMSWKYIILYYNISYSYIAKI